MRYHTWDTGRIASPIPREDLGDLLSRGARYAKAGGD